ncbi:hypothetical protein [Bradyrhizobium australafricanum]|uniref:hypothetical protein n=1 Tax=Bradyrhizobium australafricanum TaxID=2821406 RepID=UPI001CE29CCD|nr:hypothetical protein [Bradyrhizobium australafricanum]MCA6105352.1 hypothetical protein [Bradyrhizobium australafricanum]
MKAPLGAPAESAGGLYFRTDVSPEQTFQAIGRLRKEARDEIDRLIRFLDDTDRHMELEPDGSDEPCLGWPEGRSGAFAGSDTDDRELDSTDDEDGHDSEPSLGSLDQHDNQERWAAGGRRDLEHDPAESGIGDFEGLHEQAGTQDWQQGSMG